MLSENTLFCRPIDDYDKKELEDMEKHQDHSTEMMEKNGKIGIVLNQGNGGYCFPEALDDELKKRGVRVYANTIKPTNKQLIEIIEEGLIDVNIHHPEDAQMRVEYIDKKYFDGPGFWEIRKSKESYETSDELHIDHRAYDLWTTVQDLRAFRSKVVLIMMAHEKIGGASKGLLCPQRDSDTIEALKLLLDSEAQKALAEL